MKCPPFFVFATKTTQPRPQVFSVNGALTCKNAAFLHFWRPFLVKHKIFPNLVIISWLWWIMRVLLANQNRGNILNKWKPLPYSEGVYCVPALRFSLHLPCWLWKVSEMTFSSFRSFVAIRTWTFHFFAGLKIYHLSLFITHMPISIWSQQYAGCMLYMNLVNGPARYKSLVAQWSEHPTGVRKVIGSISCRTLRFFLCSVLVTCWSHHFSNFHNFPRITTFLIRWAPDLGKLWPETE